MAKLRAIDLCCGGGGWACAARGLPMEIVLAVDFWEPATMTYRLNHPHIDVQKADLRDNRFQSRLLGEARKLGVNVVLGGVPCEWLSVYRCLQKVTAAEIEENRATLDACLRTIFSLDHRPT